ncbi:MAG: Glu/Leu/Phe/Val dehydrogenase [Bacteroidetes bacterium]|nr:Glu/Leu/Phe/Val dehydrogenase [Bacteroidota bacterium]MBM3423907.1 Glu/Leu/Phe/Val dehydrogenase [Bacteroidota bacterium]
MDKNQTTVPSEKVLNPLETMQRMGHEQLVFCNDAETGLRAIISIHNTVLGPALGGTRMWMYEREADAVMDVLRLSRGMTYKNAISNLDLGGGKAVIIGDSRTMKSEALFRRFGQFVDSLSGKYITAEDVGINPNDMVHVSKETKNVVGLPGKSGDPSPVTAYGVYMGMKACAAALRGNDSLKNLKIAVQGVGHVGRYLVQHLTAEGAELYITDIHQETLKEVAREFGAIAVDPKDIYNVAMDIYAPCALGATLNDENLEKLSCSIIAGAANNQLEDEERHGQLLMDKGIIYAPDFAINAGGVINCFSEVSGKSQEWSQQKAEEIYQTIIEILRRAAIQKVPSYKIANQMAEERLRQRGSLNA